MNCTGYYFYMLSYLTLLPKYDNCVFRDPQPLDPEAECTAENICADNSQILSHEIDWSDKYSLHNWVEKLDLTCEPGWKIGLIGSMVFVGWVSTLVWLPRISDMYGRKWIFFGGMVADWVLFILIFVTKSLNWMIVVTTIFGMMTTIRVNIGFVYMMEMMPKRKQSFYASLYNTFEGTILLQGTIYFWFISKDWIYFTLFGFALQCWNCIAILFVPESPRWLIEL